MKQVTARSAAKCVAGLDDDHVVEDEGNQNSTAVTRSIMSKHTLRYYVCDPLCPQLQRIDLVQQPLLKKNEAAARWISDTRWIPPLV